MPYLVCSVRPSNHVFRKVEEQDEERLVRRFCEVEGKMNEVLSALHGLQGRDDEEEDGAKLAAKVFVLEHQLRSGISESDRRADRVLQDVWEEIGRLREYSRDFDQ